MPSTASAGVDTKPTSVCRKISKITVSTNDKPKNRVMVLPVKRPARRRSPAPTAWPMQTVVPIASPSNITVSMCITWEPTDTAVVSATVPKRPIISKSAIPYSVCKK